MPCEPQWSTWKNQKGQKANQRLCQSGFDFNLLVSFMRSLNGVLHGCCVVVMTCIGWGYWNQSCRISYYSDLDVAMAQRETAICLMIAAIAL